jgi:hypothetical protein
MARGLLVAVGLLLLFGATAAFGGQVPAHPNFAALLMFV